MRMGAGMRNSRLGAEPPVVRVWTGRDQDEPCPGSPPGRADWRPRGTLRLGPMAGPRALAQRLEIGGTGGCRACDWRMGAERGER